VLNLHGPWGWSLFAVIWGLALSGIAFKLWFVDYFEHVSTAVYVAMGWLVVIAAKPLLAHVPAATLLRIVAGGLLYSTGVVFYLWQRLPFSHAVRHLFLLAGSTCHYFAVLRSVVSPRV
jgi:hemolysin III